MQLKWSTITIGLKTYHFYDGKWLSFEFESGIKVEGLNITGIRNAQGKLILIRLKDCTITYKNEYLFQFINHVL